MISVSVDINCIDFNVNSVDVDIISVSFNINSAGFNTNSINFDTKLLDAEIIFIYTDINRSKTGSRNLSSEWRHDLIVTCVKVYVKKEHIDEFIKATIENHRNSMKEQGNLRFDVLQSIHNPAEFTLYEAYRTDEDAAAHKETAHYAVWRDKVAPWMEKPREGVPHRVVEPVDEGEW